MTPSMEFDSLVLVEVAVELSRRFDTDVSHEEVQEAGNVTGTVEFLKSKGVAV
ncbi:phosphopantetheine-binding protein [Streptomyces sp. B8F3]|uniref:phosphopantetheine-binding protein n=1 Tax=unclassified Streptomyces TaxID=2593676 RepID=UPI00325FC144